MNCGFFSELVSHGDGQAPINRLFTSDLQLLDKP